MKLHPHLIYILGFFICLLIGSGSSLAQNCINQDLPVTPDERFEFSGNEVTDLQTGLIWQRCSVGQEWTGTTCTGSAVTYTWPAALALASADWHIPNINELLSIVETTCVNPAINSNIFPTTVSEGYWSSSPHARNPSGVWAIGFGHGFTFEDIRSRAKYVRLVRGGE